MVKRVLMIAYHYPPLRGGSGIHRTLSFTEYLPQLGWEPTVLSVSHNAYPDCGLAEAAPQVPVHRSFALDAARQLAIHGRYPALLAQPDRWISWWLSAVPAGLRLIRAHEPQFIWSSYPIATAHLIALTLHRLTGIPWIADQRDPMIDTGYPPDPRRRRIHGWIERQAVTRGAAIVCTTPGAVRDLNQRFPQADTSRIALIENGYDEVSFIGAEIAPPAPRADAPFRLLHSGVIYPSERDPTALFAALARLLAAGTITPANFRLVLRATGHDQYLRNLIARHQGLSHIIELAPPLTYREALGEMLNADGLLLLQAANCNGQIPAKLYEYLRARRPLLALTHPDGDSAGLLRRAGIDTMARLDSADDIAGALPHFLRLCRDQQAPIAPPALIARHSRAARARELAALLERIHCKEQP
ncbi:glycosyltransferase [Pseudoduganella sp. FT25W]|uniref:Glycosyltransferase n=1 Tax=Duganella alba TaxID=2666081 RepID=A0A6L5Q9U8_9BURK|nr:glycosyltransferase [Duganella alba]MRX06429.1 glycosyltransferase [Duganella alba]MRX14823.1 glycosyltransferase [Duganella alba]